MGFRTAPLLWPVLPALASGGFLAAYPRSASAADCSGIVSACINDDALWPHAGPARFVAVGSTETVAREQLGFGLLSTYLSRPMVIHVSSPGGAGADQYAVNDQVNGTFMWSYGVSDRLELDLALPLTYGQGGTGLAPVTGGAVLRDTATRDMRFGLAYALVTHPRGGQRTEHGGPGVLARLEASAPTGDAGQFASEGRGVFVPSVAADYWLGRFFVGAELGARLRPTSELLGARVGTQVITSVGAGVEILPLGRLTAAVEAWALPTLDEQDNVTRNPQGAYVTEPNGQHIVPAEWQLSASTAPLRSGDLSIQLGGGTAIPPGDDTLITRPRFRFTLGIRWAPRSAVAPLLSAPAGPPPPPPVDLHLGSSRDACTDEPDLVDGFKDDDGCPDEDQDKDGIDDRLDRCPLASEDFAGLTDGCPENRPGDAP